MIRALVDFALKNRWAVWRRFAPGSDSQRPFATVIVGGLIANLVIGVFPLPTLYVWMANEHDVLPVSVGGGDF